MENESKIVERVVKLETKAEQHDKDIIDLKDTQRMMYEMNGNIKMLVEKIGSTNEEICGIKNDVGSLREDMNDVKTKADKKDAQKWDKLIWIIIGAVVMAVLGMAFKQIGLV